MNADVAIALYDAIESGSRSWEAIGANFGLAAAI